jgi:hypothetical protein
MFSRLRNLLTPPEAKSSRTARLVAFESGGKARWSPRNYPSLAREGYLANAIVHRSVRLIAENAAACSFLVFEGAAERDAHPLSLLLTRPNPRQDGGVFFEMLYAHLLLAGNAYIEAVALNTQVRELYALRPDRVKLVPGADGWAEAYEYGVGARCVRFDQLGQSVPPILHLTFFHPLDDHYGLAPIEAAAVAVDLRDLPVTLDNAVHVGINTTASSPNLLNVKSNAALLSAINVADGGSGDMRLQVSKESAAKTASVFFSDNFSGRAEFGLVGSDAFKLKVSADGSAWVEAFTIDQSSGNLALPRGVALTGVIAPPQITASQNNYNPTGVATAAVMQLSSDASRNITGLAGGAEGRLVSLINVGSKPIVLLDESTSSTAANRFTLGGNLTIPARQAAMLRYDGTAARWQAISAATGLLAAANNLADLANTAAARGNLGVRDVLTANRIYYVRSDGNDGNSGLANTSGGAFLTIQKAINVCQTIDLSGFAVTIQVGNGTYTGATVCNVPFLGGLVTLSGDTTTPGNVVVSVTSNDAINVSNGAALNVQGLKLGTTTSGSCLVASASGIIAVTGKMDFGASAGAHVYANFGGFVLFGTQVSAIDYNITGSAGFHHISQAGGMIRADPMTPGGNTVTITGTPAFSVAFAYASENASIRVSNYTFSGSATGQRYNVSMNATINTFGSGASYIPGNSAGATATGGQYN